MLHLRNVTAAADRRTAHCARAGVNAAPGMRAHDRRTAARCQTARLDNALARRRGAGVRRSRYNLRPSPANAASPEHAARHVVPHDPRGNRLRTRQAHRRAGGREARGGDRAAQSLAPAAGAGAAAARDHAQEHPDDRAHRRGQDRNRAPAGAARRRAVRQGRGDQVHRGRLCRARRRHDHPRSRGSRDQGNAGGRDAQGPRPRRRRRRGTPARRAAAAGPRRELHRHEARRLGHPPEIPQDAARRGARRPRSRDRGRGPAGADGDHGAARHGGTDEPDPGHVPADGQRTAQAHQDHRRRRDEAADRRGSRAAPQRRRRQGQGAGRRGTERHRVPGRDRQDRLAVGRCTAPTSPGRACSATCCRWSRAPRCRPSTGWSRPTTSCSSPPARSTCRSLPTSSPRCRDASRSASSFTSLSVSDFEQILTATDACLTRQYAALLGTEQVHLEFHPGRRAAAGRNRLRGKREAGEHRRPPPVHGDGAPAGRRVVPRRAQDRRHHRHRRRVRRRHAGRHRRRRQPLALHPC